MQRSSPHGRKRHLPNHRHPGTSSAVYLHSTRPQVSFYQHHALGVHVGILQDPAAPASRRRHAHNRRAHHSIITHQRINRTRNPRLKPACNHHEIHQASQHHQPRRVNLPSQHICVAERTYLAGRHHARATLTLCARRNSVVRICPAGAPPSRLSMIVR